MKKKLYVRINARITQETKQIIESLSSELSIPESTVIRLLLDKAIKDKETLI